MVDSQAPTSPARASARQLMAALNARRSTRGGDGQPPSLTGLIRRPPTSHRRTTKSRRKPTQAVVAVSVAIALTGGGVWVWWTVRNISGPVRQSIAGPDHHVVVGSSAQSQSTAPSIPDLPNGSARWASRVRSTLHVLGSQLNSAEHAAKAWDGLPASKRSGPVPGELVSLHTRLGYLTTQQTTLHSMLYDWQSLGRTHSALVDTEGQLSKITVASSGVGSGGPQYAVLVDQAQRQRRTIDNELPVVRADMARPLPVISSAVDPNTTAVLTAVYKRANGHADTSTVSASTPSNATTSPAQPAQVPDTSSVGQSDSSPYAQQMLAEASREANQLLAALGGQ